MEEFSNKTYELIVCSKNKKEAEEFISKALFKMVEHGVNNHIISRFLLKLSDRLEITRNKTKEIDKRILLNEAIIFIKQIDFTKMTKR